MTGKRYTSVEKVSAAYALAWGIFVMMPFDTFSHYPRLYAPMTELITQEFVWGAIFSLSGIAALFLIFTNRGRWAAVLMGVCFTSFAVLLFNGDAESPGWVIFTLIAFFNFFHWRAEKWTLPKG